MKELIIRILSRFIPEIRPLVLIYRHQLRNKNSYLYLTGWTRSIVENRPCQSDGSDVPWMNYSVITLIQGRLNKNMRLFEYGSGYSTLFFSKLVGDVVSVEYDLTWYGKISKELPKNAQVMFVKNDVDGSYCRAIHQVHEFFDIVVVDGRDRVNCIKQALAKLNENGVLLLDDSQREYYQEGIDYAVRQGFKRLDIEGLKPAEHGVNRTTIFYRSTNCFNL
jgi:hypothetical protein